MKVLKKISDVRTELEQYKNKKIVLVPTMGYLHEGHLSLVKEAKKYGDIVIMSIFVNPIQFGPNEDFEKYPRDFERDEKLAENAGVDFIFYPEKEEMYKNHKTYITVNDVTEFLCGEKRPGHFTGVATVVLKLFNIIKPSAAVFGIKDAQQVRVIEKMVEDLNVDIEIIRAEIIREKSGLALSSRNKYLTEEGRKKGLILNISLKEAKQMIENGERSAEVIKNRIVELINTNVPDAKIDYIEIVDYESVTPAETIKGECLIAEAVYIDGVRLIDNVIIKL